MDHDLLGLAQLLGPEFAGRNETLDAPESFRRGVIFSPATLRLPSLRFGTHGLRGEFGTSEYSACTVRAVYIVGTTEAFRALGLCVLGAIFLAPPAEVTIRLLSDDSELTTLTLRPDRLDRAGLDAPEEWESGLVQRPSHFVYRPGVLTPSPLSEYRAELRDLPFVRIEGPEAEIGGSDVALSRLANTFLNVAEPGQRYDSYALEIPAGFGGVAGDSAELRIRVVARPS